MTRVHVPWLPRVPLRARSGDWFGSAALEPCRVGGGGRNTVARQSTRESYRHVGARDDSSSGLIRGYDDETGALHRTSGRAMTRVTVLELRRSTLRAAKEVHAPQRLARRSAPCCPRRFRRTTRPAVCR